MANRRPQNGSGRRMDFQRNDRGKSYGRSGVSPWQGSGPSSGLPNLLPLTGGSTEATLALASNIINLLQPRQNAVPSLLDMPIRRDFGPSMGRYDRNYGSNRMGNQHNFRRTGNYNHAGERISTNRKPFKPNDGQRQHKSSPKKDADSKAKPVKESDGNEPKDAETTEQGDKDQEETRREPPKTRYDDINSQLLKCHICNKSMWDGRSFENHLNGRAHAIMMQKTAESYALTADTMRQEIKIREMKRTRKAGQQQARDFYCAMCDMYAADGAIHRTTVGHRKLKKYLHPTCTCCQKEMPTRIELDEHRLTAEHLKNMQDKQDVNTKPKPEVMVISTLKMEQQYVREDRQRRRRDDRAEEKQDEERDAEGTENKEGEEESQDESLKKDEAEEDTTKQETAGKKSEAMDVENTIVDYNEGDDLTGTTKDMFPAYSTTRGVGRSFLSEFRCFQCRLCHKLLDSEETADVHVRTWRHHQLFVRLLADKSGLSQHNQQDSASKRTRNSDSDGNWKRRKTAVDDEQDNDDQNKDANEQDQNSEEQHADLETEPELLNEPDQEMPDADQTEDWEQSVDEILQDEARNTGENLDESQMENFEEETNKDETPAPVVEKPKSPIPVATPLSEEKSRGSPRGRGRGRPRGRGRS